jgi:hypothetical protein
MADYTLSALAFAKVFQKDLVEIGNSSAGFLRRLDVVSYPGISKDWVVMDSDGYDQSTGFNLSEMGSLATYSTNPQLTPSLAWARLADSFQVSGTALRAAPAGNPDGLINLIGTLLKQKVQAVAALMGQQAFTGSAANQLVGLQTICDDSVTYAGITRNSTNNPSFRGQRRDLAGATVTIKNVQDWINSVAKRNGGMKPDMIVTTYEIQSKLASLASLVGNYQVAGPQQGIQLQAGYMALMISGVEILADFNCPANELFVICKSGLQLAINPFSGSDGWVSTLGQDTAGVLPFNMGVKTLPSTLDSVPMSVMVECQLQGLAPSRLLRATNVGS